MKDHEGDIKQYRIRSESYYAEALARAINEKNVTDVIHFGFYSPDGGTSGEMSMKWHVLGGQPIPRLECYDDGWHALAQFKDVIDAMAEVDGECITPKQFCELLDKCGFMDATQREWR